MKGISDDEMKNKIDSLLDKGEFSEIFHAIDIYDLSDDYYPSYDKVNDKIDEIHKKNSDFDIGKRAIFMVKNKIPIDKYLDENAFRKYISKMDNPLEKINFIKKFNLPEEFNPTEQEVKKYLEDTYEGKYFIKSNTFNRGLPTVFKVTFTGLAKNSNDKLVPAVQLKKIIKDGDKDDGGVWDVDYLKSNFNEVDLQDIINRWEKYIEKYKENLDKYRKEINK
jgi:hypothetical protein